MASGFTERETAMTLKFKVGDRVQLIEDLDSETGPYAKGRGEIVGIWDDDPETDVPYPYSVKFELDDNGFYAELLAEHEIEPA